MEILAPGTIDINDCVVLAMDDLQYVMVWPEGRTFWDGESIQFTTRAGENVTVSDRQMVEVTGGPLDDDWIQTIDWVQAPPSSCPQTRGWRVYDIDVAT
jgi:hypothetical protein